MQTRFLSRSGFGSASYAATAALLLGGGCVSEVDPQPEEVSTQTHAVVYAGISDLDLAANGTHSVVEGEYSVPAAPDPRVLDVVQNGQAVSTDVRGKLYIPQGAGTFGAGPYPVAVFLHGNHATCRTPSTTTAPDIDSNTEFTLTGACPGGQIEVPSYLGYEYIARHLASLGYAVVSINANRGITGFSTLALPSDPELVTPRAELVLKHLALLRSWDQGAALPTGAQLGVTLGNRLDFTHVGLMGHSMGGEGVRAAFERLVRPPTGSYGNDAAGIHVDGIFEIAPTDLNQRVAGNPANRVLIDAPEAHWATMLGSCDNEVTGLPATGVFTRRRLRDPSTSKVLSAVFTVPGANHAYFNQQWAWIDGPNSSCLAGQPYLWNPEWATNFNALYASTHGSEQQRAIGLMTLSAFFRGFVGSFPQAHRYQKVFDSQIALPPSLGALPGLPQPSREAYWHGRTERVTGTGSTASTVGSYYQEYAEGVTQPGKERQLVDVTWSAANANNRYDLILWDTGRSLDGVWALSASLARYHAIPRETVPADAYDPWADVPLDIGVQLLTTGGVSGAVRLTSYGPLLNRVNQLTPCDMRWSGTNLPAECLVQVGVKTADECVGASYIFGPYNDGTNLGMCYSHQRQYRALVFQEVVLKLSDFALTSGTRVRGLRFTFNGTPSGHLLVDRSVLLRQHIKGDANGDGIVSMIDARMTSQYASRLSPAPFYPSAADANCNGVTDIVDALMIAQYCTGTLLPVFPCE